MKQVRPMKVDHEANRTGGSRLSDIPEPNDPVPYQEKRFTNWLEHEAAKLDRRCE